MTDLRSETKHPFILQMWVWWRADRYCCQWERVRKLSSGFNELLSNRQDFWTCLNGGSLTVTQTQSHLHPACYPASQSPSHTRSSAPRRPLILKSLWTWFTTILYSADDICDVRCHKKRRELGLWCVYTKSKIGLSHKNKLVMNKLVLNLCGWIPNGREKKSFFLANCDILTVSHASVKSVVKVFFEAASCIGFPNKKLFLSKNPTASYASATQCVLCLRILRYFSRAGRVSKGILLRAANFSIER